MASLLIDLLRHPQRIVISLASPIMLLLLLSHPLLQCIIPASQLLQLVLVYLYFLLFVLLTHIVLLEGVESLNLGNKLSSFAGRLDQRHVGVPESVRPSRIFSWCFEH